MLADLSHLMGEIAAGRPVDETQRDKAPFTDCAPTGPDFLFSDADIERIIATLGEVRATATVQGAVG